MLRTFHVENFKCLRDVKVDLAPFTVLIGPNDSGKTSILDALRLIGQTFTREWSQIFTDENRPEVLAWRHEPGTQIRWKLAFGDGSCSFDYQWSYPSRQEQARCSNGASFRKEGPKGGASFTSTTSGTETPEHFSQFPQWQTVLRSLLEDASPESVAFREGITGFVSALRELPRYRLDPDALRAAAVPQANAVLTPSGDNLVAVLDRLISGPERSAIVELEAGLRAAIPTIHGIALPTVEGGNGTKVLEFSLAGKGKSLTTIPCAHASDGAMLLTAFLALAYSEQPGMLLIEEPENGLHPSRLRAVVEMLRKLSTGEVGTRPRQVILTTHSPLLLNYARPEEVRIVRRDPESGTRVTPLTEVPDIEKLLAEFAVGELWYLLGEDALVEGKKP